MKNRLPIIIIAVVILAGASGLVLYKTAFAPKPKPQIIEEQMESIPPADSSILVDVAKSKTQANAVLLSVKGMAGKMKTVAYELTYDSQGITQGVSAKPVEVDGKDAFERDIYLGTCSRNVCRPHVGVTKVSVTLLFTDVNDKKSQFSKEYPL